MALETDGTVVSWGGTRTVPANLGKFIAIAVGNDHSLALKSDGTVVAWGNNLSGQTNVPVGLSGVVAIAAGEDHSLALKSDGTVVAWGNNYYGQTNVPVGLNGVVAIAAGGNHSLALKSDGTVVAWGDSSSAIPVNLSKVIAISAGGGYSLALKSDGTVVAWGYNYNGETNVPVGLSGVVAIAAGGKHSLALKSDGTVVAWGNNLSGQTNVPIGLSGVVAIAAGNAHSLALKSDGTVVAWGDNEIAQCVVPGSMSGVVAIAAGYAHSLALKNDGTVVEWGQSGNSEQRENAIAAGLNGIVAIAAGSWHSMALKKDGTVVAWGDNSSNQSSVPTGLSGVVAIAAGYSFSLALKSNGTVVAWGNNLSGQTNVPVGLSGVVAIAAGGAHSLALKSDGTVVAWGSNGYGATNVPVGLNGVVAIAAEDAHSLALKSDGTVVAWGDNYYGQTNVPVGLNGVVAIAAGEYHSLALVAASNQSPTIQIQPSSQTAQTSNDVTLKVTANGSPSLTYQWRKNGVNIPDATNATLTLDSVTAADAGVYSVVVSNPYGSATSSLASLVIQGDPANWNPSFVTVTPQTAPADGSTPVTATVTLLDKNYNPLVGKTVTFYAQPASTAPIPLPMHPTDSKGQTTTTITSTTAGKMTIGALDVSDGFPVPNSATVQFTTGTVVPGTDLANAIQQLYSEASFDLGTYIPNIAASEGQNGDYFQGQIGNDKAEAAATASGGALGAVLALIPGSEDPIEFVAKKVAKEAGKTLTKDLTLSYLLSVMASSGSGCSDFAQTVATQNSGYQQALLQKEQSLLAGIPPGAVNNSAAYINDLNLRSQANRNVLRDVVLVSQQNLLNNLQFKSSSGQIDLLGPLFNSLDVAAFASGLVCTPATGVALKELINADETLITGNANEENLNNDQLAYNTAVSSLDSCYNYSGSIYLNTLSAFNAISQGQPLDAVTARIGPVSSEMTATPISGTIPGAFLNLVGQILGYSTTVYINGENTFVNVDNTSALPAYFTVIVSYSHTITVNSDNAAIGQYTMTLPVVASATKLIGANQTGQVQIYYGDETHGTLPDVGAPISVYVLGGYNKNQEIYYIAQSSTTMQWPASVLNGSQTLAKPLIPEPAGGPTTTNNFVFETPIKSFVVQNSTNQTYQAHILVQNPFAIPLQAVVTQPLPAGISVLSTTGLLSGGSIIWTNTLVTNGLADDTFTFTLPVLPGTQTNLPAPTVMFSDSTGTNSWTTQAAAATFTGLFPIQVASSIPQGAFGADTPMQVTVSNPVAGSESGVLTVSVTDLNGNAVTNFSETFSVNAGAGTNLNFTLPGTLPVGQYFITGTLNMNGGTGQVLSGVYVVPQIPLMLHPGVPGLPTTNGMNLSLQGPIGSNYVIEASADLVNWTPLIYFTSTNSPTYFTDTTATNSGTRFYRAVMVSVTAASPWLQAQISEGNIILSWPSSAQNFSLQTTTNLSDPNSWVTLTNVPAIVNFQNTITNPISGGQGFYRLIQSQ